MANIKHLLTTNIHSLYQNNYTHYIVLKSYFVKKKLTAQLIEFYYFKFEIICKNYILLLQIINLIIIINKLFILLILLSYQKTSIH